MTQRRWSRHSVIEKVPCLSRLKQQMKRARVCLEQFETRHVFRNCENSVTRAFYVVRRRKNNVLFIRIYSPSSLFYLSIMKQQTHMWMKRARICLDRVETRYVSRSRNSIWQMIFVFRRYVRLYKSFHSVIVDG